MLVLIKEMDDESWLSRVQCIDAAKQLVIVHVNAVSALGYLISFKAPGSLRAELILQVPTDARPMQAHASLNFSLLGLKSASFKAPGTYYSHQNRILLQHCLQGSKLSNATLSKKLHLKLSPRSKASNKSLELYTENIQLIPPHFFVHTCFPTLPDLCFK